MSRLDGAILAVRQAIASATGGDIPLEAIGKDEDLVDDLSLDNLELISVALMLEEVFQVPVSEEIFEQPLYRTPAALAEWLIRKSEEAEWAEVRRQRRKA